MHSGYPVEVKAQDHAVPAICLRCRLLGQSRRTTGLDLGRRNGLAPTRPCSPQCPVNQGASEPAFSADATTDTQLYGSLKDPMASTHALPTTVLPKKCKDQHDQHANSSGIETQLQESQRNPHQLGDFCLLKNILKAVKRRNGNSFLSLAKRRQVKVGRHRP